VRRRKDAQRGIAPPRQLAREKFRTRANINPFRKAEERKNMSTEIRPELVEALARSLQEKYGFSTVTQLDKAVTDLVKRSQARVANGRTNDFSITRAIRGLAAQRGGIISPETKSDDVEYAQKALSTGATPGSYLVPTIQAEEIIQILSTGGIARSSGARIWNLDGIQKLTVPTQTAFPTVEFLGQNTAQTATDPNLGQISFDLKTRRSLTVVPNELLRTSTPAYDAFLSELLGLAFAEHEDSIFFAASAATGGPTPFYATAGITTVMVGGSANGGSLAYSDILAVLKAAAAAKVKGACAWYMSPRTFFQRVLGLLDSQSRPIIVSDSTAAAPFRLFGYPIYVSPAIPENLTNGSGTSQSYILFTNPKFLHVAQSQGIDIAVSTERYFELNQVGVRCVQGIDFATAPAAGVVALKGVN